jgi:plastocyanin
VVLTRAAAGLSMLALGLAVAGHAGSPILAQSGPGSIRGRVDIQRPPAPIERRVTAVEPGEPMPHESPRDRRAVIYFETAPRGAFEDRESPHATLDQRNEAFVPHLLAITVGTVVDFPNSDRTYHNVFSLSKTKRFDLGRYGTGRSKSIMFDRPGIVRVFCDIHSHMNAFILVFNHRFFAVTDADGRYEIDGVPAGTYTLSAWYEGAVRDQGSVTIAPDSRTAELNFTVR